MNTAAAAGTMVQRVQITRRNIAFDEMLGSSFFVKNVPMIALQKDGNVTLVRVVRGNDEKVADLNTDAAAELLATWLSDVVIDIPSERVQARLDARLAELGWK